MLGSLDMQNEDGLEQKGECPVSNGAKKKPANGITMLQSKVGALIEKCESLTLQNAELEHLLAMERERTDRAHNSQQEAWRRETLTHEQELPGDVRLSLNAWSWENAKVRMCMHCDGPCFWSMDSLCVWSAFL